MLRRIQLSKINRSRFKVKVNNGIVNLLKRRPRDWSPYQAQQRIAGRGRSPFRPAYQTISGGLPPTIVDLDLSS